MSKLRTTIVKGRLVSSSLESKGPSQAAEIITAGIPVASNFRNYLIFGANTDVGKTIVATGLVRQSLRLSAQSKQGHLTRYIKPLQCGGNDAEFVRRHSQLGFDTDHQLQTWTLFNWKTPASPHVASRMENHPRSDDEVITAIERIINTPCQNSCDTFIETAGGVLSPSAASPFNNHARHARLDSTWTTHNSENAEADGWGWSTQADLYQKLFLPTILVGDARLGGISSTLSALESLILRGYDVHGVVFIQNNDAHHDSSCSNHLALREYYAGRKIKMRSGLGKVLLDHPDQSIISLPQLPPLTQSIDPWFDMDETREKFGAFHQLLSTRCNQYIQEVHNMRSVGKDMIWWPFTQHSKYKSNISQDTMESKITLIDGANGDYFHVIDQKRHKDDGTVTYQRKALFDACASWWTAGLGHGDSSLALTAAAAAGRYGHVIFPDVVHSPAVSLCTLLLGSHGPGHEWANRVFFSDDGSTAMEIAVKMGMKKFCVDRNIQVSRENTAYVKLSLCAQKGCYHGDTLGVMNVAEPNIFNGGQHPWYEPKGLFLDFPIVRFRNGALEIAFPDGFVDGSRFRDIAEVYDVDSRLSTALYPLYYDSILRSWVEFEQKSSSRSVPVHPSHAQYVFNIIIYPSFGIFFLLV